MGLIDAGTLQQYRERMGAVGVWLGNLGTAPATGERAAAARIESMGFGSLWVPEVIGGKEAFAHQGILLSATERLVTGTGIANLWARHPATMQGGAATLADAYPGRLVLGIGVSHAAIVNRSGAAYERPLERMASYLDAMDRAAEHPPLPDRPAPRVLAALRPKMLDLARRRADGAHPYFVPTSHTPMAREALGPDKLLVPEQAVLLQASPGEARALARQHMAGYLQLPNYRRSLIHLGFGDDLEDHGSDRLVDAIVAWGTPQAVAARVREHLDSGADHVVVQPLAADLQEALAQLETLAGHLLA